MRDRLPDLNAFQGKLSEQQGENLLQFFRLLDDLSQQVERLYAYAHMKRDQDTRVSRYQAMHDRAFQLIVQIQSAAAFANSEIMEIPEATLLQFQEYQPGLALYRYKLSDLLRQKPHILSAEQEKLLARMGEIAHAPSNIFSMINDADMTFPVVHDEHGNPVRLTKGNFITFLESGRRETRKEAFEALYRTYESHRNTLAATLQASVKRDVIMARIRRFATALEAALFQDNIPVEVYENLIDAVHGHLSSFHRHLQLRQQLLAVKPLHMYDLYTPMVPTVQRKFTYEEAVQLVVDAVKPLGRQYQNDLKQGLQDRWVDVYENEGKRGGAYSTAAYGVHPYVLMNFQGGIHDVFTLAHEMGHAMHSFYSNQSQPYVYADYSIFVAEVASTLNESLLLHHMLQSTSDPKMRLYLLNYHLDQFRTVVFRQTMFAEFEKWMHTSVEQGEALTAESLNDHYLALNKLYHGDGMEVDDLIRYEWARIPHFYSAFYVYKYATGFSAATALAGQILEEGGAAVERYLEFLSSGGSDYPIEILRRAGVDLTSPQPIHDALRLYDRLVGEMEEAALR